MMTPALMLLFLVAGQKTSSSQPGDAGKPSPTTATVSLPADESAGKAFVRLLLPPETTEQAALQAQLADDSPSPPKVSFSNQGQSATESVRHVYFVAGVTDAPRQPFSLARKATLQVGGKEVRVSYVLTNRAAQVDKLPAVVAAAEWSALARPLPIIVSTADTPATRLEASAVFTEKSTHVALPKDAVILCTSEHGACGEVSVPAYSSKTVFLRYVGPRDAGIYVGSLTLHSLEYAGSAPAALTIDISTPADIWAGVGVVGLGVLLAWWVKSWTSNRIQRDQALLPVAVYQERLRGLGSALQAATGELHVACPELARAVDEWTAKMNPDRLEAEYGLPGAWPSPFPRASGGSRDLTPLFSQADAALTLLSVFVVEGVERVAKLAANGDISRDNATQSVSEIDKLYVRAPKPADASTQIAKMISAVQVPRKGLMEVPSEAPLPALSFTTLLVEIRRLNAFAWFVLLVAAALGTILALVLKPGFGTFSDYLLCFATSFGVPTVGGAALPAQTAATTVTKSTQGTSGSNAKSGSVR
jgi:hypothetical protein